MTDNDNDNENRDLAATEARLRDAIGARAGSVPDARGDGGLGSIKGVVGNAMARDRRRHRALAVLGVAAAIVIIGGSIALLRDDKGQKVATTSSDTPTTGAPTTVPGSTTITSAPPAVADTAIWPLASAASRSFDSPESAAFSFATEYLHMSDQVQVGSPGAAGDGAPGDVAVGIQPFKTGGPTTSVVLRNSPHGWVVLGASTPDIKVDTPKAGDPANDPLTVSGQSTAFEAVINLELRPQDTGERVGDVAATMGGANGELGPFSTTLHPPKDNGPLVLLVYEADASGQGEISAATVIRLGALAAGGGSGAAPTTYVALSKSGDVTVLDFDGHVQRPLATGLDAIRLDYEPTSRIVAVQVTNGTRCGAIRFFADGGGTAPPTIDNASEPAFSPDGTKLAYHECSTGIHVRDLATGDEHVLTGTDGRQFLSLTWVGNGTVAAVESKQGFALFDAASGAETAASVKAGLIAGRGRFGTVAFFDGTTIKSLNVTSGDAVPLVNPPRGPVTLDADASGASLIWVDATGDVWTWSGGDPKQVASGMAAAAW